METERALTVQTPNEKLVIAKADIETRTPTNVSMMPEGLFDKLNENELRDLVAYLMKK
jgi:putative heme-binding domain-containing protein